MQRGRNFIIIPDAFPFLIVGLILSLLLYLLWGFYGIIVPGLFTLFTLYFFRNPERKSHNVSPFDVMSPADGVVLYIDNVQEDRVIHGKAIKVSIFLNIFNVHVNRAPIAGKVTYLKYQPGKFLPAFKGHASHLNERNYLGICCQENPKLSLLVVQITGFIARRIVCWFKEGSTLEQGERFGLIKFGSCTEVYLPEGSEVLVQEGQKVKGGETVIGRLLDA